VARLVLVIEQSQAELAGGHLAALERLHTTLRKLDESGAAIVAGQPAADYRAAQESTARAVLAAHWETLAAELAALDASTCERLIAIIPAYLAADRHAEWAETLLPAVATAREIADWIATAETREAFAHRPDAPLPPPDARGYILVTILRDDAAFSEPDFAEPVAALEDQIFAHLRAHYAPTPVYTLPTTAERDPDAVAGTVIVELLTEYVTYHWARSQGPVDRNWGHHAYQETLYADFTVSQLAAANGEPATQRIAVTKTAPTGDLHTRMSASLSDRSTRRSDMILHCQLLGVKIMGDFGVPDDPAPEAP
jgi:hypothetical protein